MAWKWFDEMFLSYDLVFQLHTQVDLFDNENTSTDYSFLV